MQMKYRNLIQVGGILFFIGISLIAISWIYSFPISLSTIDEITFSQFHPILWPGIIISLLGLFLIGYMHKKIYIKAICSSLILFFLYIPTYFFSYLSSSDCGKVRGMFYVFQKVGIDPQVIPYFEFPTFFSLNETMHLIISINDKGVALVSFSLYGVLFGLFLFLFYFTIRKNYDIYLESFLLVFIYFIGMFTFLIFQWAPQSLAIAYFFLLLFITTRLIPRSNEYKWKAIFLIVFTSLVFTHAFTPVIFLLFFAILSFKKRYLLNLVLISTSIYVIFTSFYIDFYLRVYVDVVYQFLNDFGKEWGTVVTRSTGDPGGSINSIISVLNRIRVPLVWIVSIIGTAILFLKRKIRYVFIALGLAGGIYLAIGLFYSILGWRAIQILFIPVTIGYMFFDKKWKKPSMIIIIFILFISVFGPMRLSYNQTHFQLDEEANSCHFLAKNIIDDEIPKIAVDQVNYGYFNCVYSLLKNKSYLGVTPCIRPGNPEFFDIFDFSMNQNEYVIYNSNLGKEILYFGTEKSQLINRLRGVTNNYKLYDSGNTFIIKGKSQDDEKYIKITPWSPNSPINKTFSKTKLVWRMDDYNAGISKYHDLNINFHYYAENITKHGGNVLISVIPNCWHSEKLEYIKYKNETAINENLELYNMDGVDFAIHGWNHHCNLEPWLSNYSEQYERFNVSKMTLEENYNIEVKWFCSPCTRFNLNTTKILAKENFSNTDYIYKSHCKCLELDNGFYIDNSTWHDSENLSESKNRWNNTSPGSDNITQILFHPTRTTGKNLSDFHDFCNWIYGNHDIWNMNFTEALRFKENKDKIQIERYNMTKFKLNLSSTEGTIKIIWDEPGEWIVKDFNDGDIIGTVNLQSDIIDLESGKSYLFMKE